MFDRRDNSVAPLTSQRFTPLTALSDLLVRRHLRRVERELRTRDVSHLSDEIRWQRLRHLDELHVYWRRGIFPRNYERLGLREPCFIDREGRTCAVAHVMIVGGEHDLAARVAARFNDARIHAMDLPELQGWADQAGLSVDELARIQPGYPYEILHELQARQETLMGLTTVFCSLAAVLAPLNLLAVVRRQPSRLVLALSLVLGIILCGLAVQAGMLLADIAQTAELWQGMSVGLSTPSLDDLPGMEQQVRFFGDLNLASGLAVLVVTTMTSIALYSISKPRQGSNEERRRRGRASR